MRSRLPTVAIKDQLVSTKLINITGIVARQSREKVNGFLSQRLASVLGSLESAHNFQKL
jgi:hypothetical protein